MQSISHCLYAFQEADFFFKYLPLMLLWQTIKFFNFDKTRMIHKTLLKNHFCMKKNLRTKQKKAKLLISILPLKVIENYKLP